MEEVLTCRITGLEEETYAVVLTIAAALTAVRIVMSSGPIEYSIMVQGVIYGYYVVIRLAGLRQKVRVHTSATTLPTSARGE
jgi:hypothetical protein